MTIVAIIGSALFALFGRWIQLHPERVVPKGHFTGPNTTGARLFRAQVAVLGIFCVVFGTWGAVFSLVETFSFGVIAISVLGHIMGSIAGVLAAIHVRREVKSLPGYVSDSPYGWWP